MGCGCLVEFGRIGVYDQMMWVMVCEMGGVTSGVLAAASLGQCGSHKKLALGLVFEWLNKNIAGCLI